MMKNCWLALLIVLAAANPGLATPSDFKFSDVGFGEIAGTIALLGKFNVMVSPELAQPMSYERQGIEPYDALEEIAKQANAKVFKIPGMDTVTYVITKADLPGNLNTPAATEGAVPTDFSFKDVELSAVVSTFAVLGRFKAGVAAPLASQKVTVQLKQVIPNQALYWVAAMLGASVEETTEADGGKKLMLVPR